MTKARNSIRDAILGADWETHSNVEAAIKLRDEIIDSLNEAFNKRELGIEARVQGNHLFGVTRSLIEIGNDQQTYRPLMTINAIGEHIKFNFYDGRGERETTDPEEAKSLIVNFLSDKKSGALTIRSCSAIAKAYLRRNENG